MTHRRPPTRGGGRPEKKATLESIQQGVNDIREILRCAASGPEDPRMDEVLCLLRQLARMEKKQMIDLTAMRTEVNRGTTVAASNHTLLEQLTDLIEAAPTSDPATQAYIDELVAALRTNHDGIVADVLAHTPAAGQPDPFAVGVSVRVVATGEVTAVTAVDGDRYTVTDGSVYTWAELALVV